MNSENKFLKYTFNVFLGTCFLLLIPLIAMQFTNEVVWTLSDFIIAGVLLFGSGTAIAFVITKVESTTYKSGMSIAIISTLLLVWVNGAVGIVGHEGEAINLLYFGIPVIGLIGALLSRFKARGMSYTLFLIAVIPVVITIVALMGFMQEAPHNSSIHILGINGFFSVLFFLSAISFRNASLDEQY